jgi:signal transduction histidine kinase
MKLTIRQKFLGFALIILSVVSILSYVSFQSNKRVLDTSKQVEHSKLIVAKTDFILSFGKDIETGSRGFIITGDSEFLEPLNEVGKAIFSNIEELRALTSNEPHQQQRIDSLNYYIHKSLEFHLMADSIRSKQGLKPAIAIISSKQGEQYMNNVRRISNAITVAEDSLLAINKQANKEFVTQSNRYSFYRVLLRILLTAMVLVVTGGYLIKSREKEKLEAEIVQQKISKQREITEAVITAYETERSHIGQELNENINQLLATSKLYNEMANKNDENRSSFLATSTGYTLMAIDEIRKLYKELVTPLMQEMGLIESIRLLADDVIKIHRLVINVSAKNFDETKLSQEFKLNLLRIVQAQINNTLKYAKAKILQISILQTNNTLLVTMFDDGIGFDTTLEKDGTGINIINRAELFKGEVIINSAPGKGCHMSITFDNSNFMQS